MAGNIKKDKRFFSLGISLIGILTLSFMGVLMYMGYSSQSLANKQTPQVRALKQIKIEIITGHLWLEEILSGDRSEDIQAVFNHFEEADDFFYPLLNGGRFGNMQILPVEDSLARSFIGDMLLLKDTLFALSAFRYEQLEQTQAGTSADRDFDAVFARFLQKSYDAEKALVELQQKNIKTYNSTQLGLIISVFALGILILIIFVWLERFKGKKQKELLLLIDKLTESEERWQFALESSGDGVWDRNAESNKVFYSKRWKEMLGYKEDEIANDFNEWDKLLHPDDKERGHTAINKYISGETDSLNLEHRLLCKDGTYKWILSRGKIIERLPDNKPLRIIGTHIDLTYRKQAEEALMSEKGFSEKIIETSSAIIVGLDKNHLIRIFNRGAETITGYTKADIIGKDWFKIFFSSDVFDDMNKVWKRAWGAEAHSYENPIIVKSGEKRIISWQTTGFYNGEDSSKNLMISIGENITERKKAEDALHESQTFNQTLLDTSPDLIYVYDIIERKNIYSNQGIQKILGYSIEEIQKMGNNILPDLMHPDDFNNYLKNIIPRYQSAKDGEIIDHEYRMKHKNGNWCWLNSKESIFMRLDDGTPKQIFGITSDITERKKAEKALNHSHNLMRYIIEHNQSDVAVHDKDLKYIYVSQSYLEHYKVKEKDVIGKHHYDVFPDLPQKWRDVHQKALTGEISRADEDPYEREDGSVDWTRWECCPWYEADGSIGGIIIYTEVITKQKQIEEELRTYQTHLEDLVKERTESLAKSQDALLNLLDDLNQQSAKLEKSNAQFAAINQELETFTYSVSHDLKAPLRGIDGYSQLLLDIYYEELNPEAREFLGNIRKSTQQMNLLIEDLLAYSRMERQGFQSEKVQFKSLIDNLLLYFSKAIKTNKIQIKLTFPKSFTPVADKDGLNLVVRNLLDNAIKFSRSNIKAKIEIGGSENDTQWLIFVKDNGIGFDMKYHDRIFKIFQRLHLAEEYEGTGIGLAMVGKAIQRMNGKIWAESEPGKGTCFYIEIRK